MQIRSTEEVMEVSYEYAKSIMECQLRKKAIDEEISEIKADYKEKGVAVGTVNKVISELKKKMKMDDGDILEQEIIQEKFESNDDIQDFIASLVK